MTVRRALFACLALGVLLLPASCSSKRRGTGGGVINPPLPSALALRTVTTGVDYPIFLTSPPADTARLFVVEKGGKIRIIKSNVLLATAFLDVTSLVSTGDEQGLLGMAFAPDYATSGRFFISYTNTAGDTRIASYHVSSGNADLAHPTADDIVLSVDQPDVNHNGGQISFGPDGMLWIGLGDGGGGGDTYNNGQSKDDLLGSMLRIDVSGATDYTIPAGNPYTGAGEMRELWNIGLRNPWRWSFDRTTGDLYLGDVGQGSREEIDVALAVNGRSPGANYGWPITEGNNCYPPGTPSCNRTGLTAPVIEYSHGDGCTVIGGYVYRGTTIAGLSGTYFYADYCSHWVRSFKLLGGVVTETTNWPALDPGAWITSFGEDARGELYLMTDTGGVYKIVAS